MKTLTTSQLAQAAGVNLETVRYYERRGLIPEPPRRSSGYRQYSEDYIGRIRSIKRAQDLGFSLDEVAELFALRVDPETACDQVKQQAEWKITEVRTKIGILQQIEQTLVDLVAACDKREPTGDCPILEALNRGL
jgi:MerR family mercuric resistance operon transcriptional regulator